MPVDPRKSKRLAHRIRRWARVHAAQRVVVTSPLRRSADTGRWLARWGWRHVVDARLVELDFGAWDGHLWADVPQSAIDAWCDDFACHAPGGGESVTSMLERCAGFMSAPPAACVVGHAGWVGAAQWLQASGVAPPQASSWPHAVGYGVQWVPLGAPP